MSALLLFFKKTAPASFVANKKHLFRGVFLFLSFCLPTFPFAYAEPLNFVSVALLPPLRSASDKSCRLCHVTALLLFFKKTAPASFVAKQRTPAKRVFFVLLDEKIRVFIRP